MTLRLARSVKWAGSSKADLGAFPVAVRNVIGFALYQAQLGLKHRDVKPLRGLGSGVLEVVTRHEGDTFRAVYSVQFKNAIYVLHAFRKKSKRGVETPKQEIELIKRRLRAAQRDYNEVYGGG